MVASDPLIAAADVSTTSAVVMVTGLVVIVIAALVGATLYVRRAAPAGPQPTSDTVSAPLSTTLHVLARERATAHVQVVMNNRVTDLYMRDGALYHAVSGAGTGNDAASDSLRWDATLTQVTVEHNVPMPAERSITFTLDQLLAGAGMGH